MTTIRELPVPIELNLPLWVSTECAEIAELTGLPLSKVRDLVRGRVSDMLDKSLFQSNINRVSTIRRWVIEQIKDEQHRVLMSLGDQPPAMEQR